MDSTNTDGFRQPPPPLRNVHEVCRGRVRCSACRVHPRNPPDAIAAWVRQRIARPDAPPNATRTVVRPTPLG